MSEGESHFGMTAAKVGESLVHAMRAELDKPKPPMRPSQGLIQRTFTLTATFRRDAKGEYHVLNVQLVPLAKTPD
jgi:hypothetical protein